MNLFCCSNLNSTIENNLLKLGYDQIMREYFINCSGYAIQLICYCPWCGKKLPTSLRDEYIVEASIALNLDPEDTSLSELREHPDLPEEFKSDVWWKKRDL